jgi:hypothetical protein
MNTAERSAARAVAAMIELRTLAVIAEVCRARLGVCRTAERRHAAQGAARCLDAGLHIDSGGAGLVRRPKP